VIAEINYSLVKEFYILNLNLIYINFFEKIRQVYRSKIKFEMCSIRIEHSVGAVSELFIADFSEEAKKKK